MGRARANVNNCITPKDNDASAFVAIVGRQVSAISTSVVAPQAVVSTSTSASWHEGRISANAVAFFALNDATRVGVLFGVGTSKTLIVTRSVSDQVLSSFDISSDMNGTPGIQPFLLEKTMSGDYVDARNSIVPCPSKVVHGGVSILYLSDDFVDMNTVMTAEIVLQSIKRAVAIFDVVANAPDLMSGLGWYSTVFCRYIGLFNKASPSNVLSMSPAFLALDAQVLFGQLRAAAREVHLIPLSNREHVDLWGGL